MPPMNMLRFPRGMTILSTAPGSANNELVLVNPVRFDESTESEFLKLGRIYSIVRIGLHEMHMQYYKTKFNAKTYVNGAKEYKTLVGVNGSYEGSLDFYLDAGEMPPVPGLKVIYYPSVPSVLKECALVVRDEALITCDAVQCHAPPRGNWFTRNAFLSYMGFSGKAMVGPIWMKMITDMLGRAGRSSWGTICCCSWLICRSTSTCSPAIVTLLAVRQRSLWTKP